MQLLATENFSWWRDVALQGVFSSIIGGLVTLGAVWITLRWERAASESKALETECRHGITFTRQLRRLLELGSSEFIPVMFYEWRPTIENVIRMSADKNLCFNEGLKVAEEVVSFAGGGGFDARGLRVENLQEVLRGLQNVDRLLNRWLSDPRSFESMTKQQCKVLVEALRAPGTFI